MDIDKYLNVAASAGGTIIGYSNGLVVVALLLVILLLLLLKERKEKLPTFCESCAHLKQKLFSNSTYCEKKCKYNPIYRHTAGTSFFIRKRLRR